MRCYTLPLRLYGGDISCLSLRHFGEDGLETSRFFCPLIDENFEWFCLAAPPLDASDEYVRRAICRGRQTLH